MAVPDLDIEWYCRFVVKFMFYSLLFVFVLVNGLVLFATYGG